MEYGILVVLLILIMLAHIEIAKLKKQVKSQAKQINNLCNATENQKLSSQFLSDDVKKSILHLKNSGKEVEAVKKMREATGMDLIEAKQYIDKL